MPTYEQKLKEKDNGTWNKNRGDRKAQIKRYKEKYPEKYRANIIVQKRVGRGTIVKPNVCEDCGREIDKRLLHAHHEDYSAPLEIIWCCADCHNERHGRIRLYAPQT